MGGVVSPGVRRLCAAAMVVLAVAGCGPAAASPAEAPVGATSSESTPARTAEADSVVLVGRIVTMDEPRVAEAVFIEDGTVAAVGTRDEVLALAGDAVPVIDIGQNVAYPGFIDAHAHWIGDRESYHVDTAQGAIDAAIRRGWTSISEQWVNPERLYGAHRVGSRRRAPASGGCLPRPELRHRLLR